MFSVHSPVDLNGYCLLGAREGSIGDESSKNFLVPNGENIHIYIMFVNGTHSAHTE